MSKNKGIILAAIAILAIGIFVLPSTMSMFVGQHYWYSVDTEAGRNELCPRCHVAEYGEWAANTANNGAHSSFQSAEGVDCTMCHTVNLTKLTNWGINDTQFNDSLGGSNLIYLYNISGDATAANYSLAWRNTSGAHAAITVDCVDCHYNASVQLQRSNEAHNVFYNSTIGTDPWTANTTTDINNVNAACIACHTHTTLNVTFIRAIGMNITANHTTGDWNISAFTANTSAYNTTYGTDSTYSE